MPRGKVVGGGGQNRNAVPETDAQKKKRLERERRERRNNK